MTTEECMKLMRNDLIEGHLSTAEIADKYCSYLNLPKGSIKRLIGRELTWSDEPVELKEN